MVPLLQVAAYGVCDVVSQLQEARIGGLREVGDSYDIS